MNDELQGQVFRLADMSMSILIPTALLLALPIAFFLSALLGAELLAFPAALMVLLFCWVWLRFRPTRFIVHRDGLRVRWPLKTREIPRPNIASARVINNDELKREIGKGMRIGAGGLWGAFGLLRTTRRGLVQMYISRTDRFVWIEMVGSRPWLITPEEPEKFVQALSSA
jgi:hypothetical protein